MWTLLREVSQRHLRHSPFRTCLVIFGIALGVSMLTAVLATNASMSAAFEDMVDRVAGKADLTVFGSDTGIPSSLTGEIAEIEGVAHAAAMLEIVTHSPDGKGGPLLLLGVDLLGDTFFLPFAQHGDKQVVEDPLALVNDSTAVLLPKKLARSRGLAVGDPLPLLTSEGERTFYVRGLLEDKGPAASFGGQVVVMFIDAAQESFARGYAVDRIDVAVDEGASVEAVQARIRALVHGKAQVEEPEGRTRRFLTALWAYQNGLRMSGLAALAVAMFLIYNAVSVSVAQRRREVGILRALGVSQGRMVRLFCIEACVMAAAGIVIGLLLAQQLATFALANVEGTINRFVLPIHPPAPEITPRIALAGALAGFIVTMFASYWPARRTNQVAPADALRTTRATSSTGVLPASKLAALGAVVALAAFVPALRGGEGNGYLAIVGMVLGLALLVPLAVKALRLVLVGAIEKLFGVPGRLGVDNVERSLGRSVTTVVALMLAVSMSIIISTYANSFSHSMLQWADDAFPADALVTAGSPLVDRHHVPLAMSVVDKLSGIKGIEGVNPNRIIYQVVRGRRSQIAVMDTQSYFRRARERRRGRQVVQGPKDLGLTALVERPRVIISENLANLNDLSAGDALTIPTPKGEQTFEIYAVVVDYSSSQGWMMMDRKWFTQHWNDQQVDSVDLFFAPGVDHEALLEAVRERLGAAQRIFVTPHDALREQFRAVAANIFAIARAPELISLLVAILGVIGTMLAAVIDRIREIGMLRAIGATRRQVVASLVAEASFIGLAAAVCGVLAGVPQGFVFLKVIGTASSGWSLPYGFPMETALRISLLVVGAAATAGFFPGQRAAAMDVKEALAYE
ncbi:MAG TPA: FtsX-like permease family protein [Polyangiales bacterium]